MKILKFVNYYFYLKFQFLFEVSIFLYYIFNANMQLIFKIMLTNNLIFKPVQIEFEENTNKPKKKV